MNFKKIAHKVPALAVVAMASLAFAACSSGGKSERGGEAGTGGVAVANRALQAVSYSPRNKGYGYKSTAVGGDFPTWSSAAKPQITQALSQVGDDYVIQVTGHTCAIGPRTAPGDGRRGNMYYSEQRAKAVRDGLVNAGVPANKLVVKGVADTQLLPGVDPKDQKQRRVTFQVVAAPK